MSAELNSQSLSSELQNHISTSTKSFAGSLEKGHKIATTFDNFASGFLPRRVVDIVSERSLGIIYRRVEDRFDSRLPLFVRTQADQIMDPGQKAQYVRAICLQTADALIGQTRITTYDKVSQSLTLAARRAILLGVRSTEEAEGIEIDPDWLNHFIQQTTNPLADPDKANILRDEFINNPPKLGSNESDPQVATDPIETAPVISSPDLTIPKSVLWALRRRKNLDLPIEEDRMRILSSLASVVLLDRNFRTVEVASDSGKRITEKHINRRWRQTQLAALDQTAKLDGEYAVSVLYGIVELTSLAEFAPQSGPAERLEERVKNLERELISPNYEDAFFHTFSFRWLPWHNSWRGGKVLGSAFWDMYDYPDHIEIRFEDRPEIKVRTVEDERGKLQERACQLLGSVEHPSSIRALLQIGGFRHSSFEEIVVESLVRKGLEQTEASKLLADLQPLSVEDTFRVAREIAEKGLVSRATVLG